MIRAVVTGAAGRMGINIVRLITETKGIKLVGAAEYPEHKLVGRDAGEVAGIGPIHVPIAAGLEKAMNNCDVVIDFTNSNASLAHIDVVAKANRSIVVGSTGFLPAQKEMIAKRRDARIFLAPNMSVGMNVLYMLVAEATRALGHDYDVEIIEMHHRMKRDAPSGSAIRLAEAVANTRGRDADHDMVHGRKGLVGERTPREIGMHAVRGGDVIGDHTVIFAGMGERIELTHKASSRETFAHGAVRAALWITKQEPGVYDVLDMLGLKEFIPS